jgi:hypothetical protein
MSARTIALSIIVALAALAFGWSLFSALERWLESPPAAVEAGSAEPAPIAAPGEGVARIKVTLFYASPDGLGLQGVEYEVPLASSPVEQAREIVAAQLRTQPEPPLLSAIPSGVTLRGVYLSERQEAFIDLDGAVRASHPGGSMHELFTIYAIVNAVTVNLPTVPAVQILIDGREVDTLAGHVDLRRPLARNDTIIVD